MQDTENGNSYYANLSNTVPKLGYLVLTVKSLQDSIFMSSTNDTSFNVTVNKLNTNTLVFNFSKSDDAADLKLNMDNVLHMQYIPSKYNLMGIDSNNYNIYANVSFEDNANASIK